MRLHLLGGPGSGKSTVARSLSVRFATQTFDLDELF